LFTLDELSALLPPELESVMLVSATLQAPKKMGRQASENLERQFMNPPVGKKIRKDRGELKVENLIEN